MLKRSKVAWSVTAPDYGRTCAVGDVVDLDARLPAGGALRDIVRPEWFESVEPTRKAVSKAPVVPAEEQDNG